MVNLKNILPKLLLSVAFITVSSTMALADSKSSGSKDKSKSGHGQPKTKICHRTGNGKYILITPANPGVMNGHMGHGDSLAKNGFCPAEILPSTVADPCNFAPTTPPSASGSKSSGKSSGKSGGKSSGKSGGKSGGKTK